MNKWLTITEAMKQLDVSRQHLYTLASRYKWRTAKRGATRFYHEADVTATPPADERRRVGYGNRQISTRVEKGD